MQIRDVLSSACVSPQQSVLQRFKSITACRANVADAGLDYPSRFPSKYIPELEHAAEVLKVCCTCVVLGREI